MYSDEIKKFKSKLKDLGFEGRGSVAEFLRKVLSHEIIFIEGKGVKIQIVEHEEIS